MRATVITGIYDNYDTPKPPLPQEGADVDWLLITDAPALDGRGWHVVYEPARPGVHPNRAAKQPKMLPWCYTDAPASVWVDASFQVVSPTFVAEALEYARPIAQFSHPWRQCLFDEAVASAPIPKYAGEPIVDQAAYYRAAGMPRGWGLWATGVIARQHTDEVREFGERWLAECKRWSFQDQVSESFVLWQEVMPRPVALPGTHLANPWLRYEGSSRH